MRFEKKNQKRLTFVYINNMFWKSMYSKTFHLPIHPPAHSTPDFLLCYLDLIINIDKYQKNNYSFLGNV